MHTSGARARAPPPPKEWHPGQAHACTALSEHAQRTPALSWRRRAAHRSLASPSQCRPSGECRHSAAQARNWATLVPAHSSQKRASAAWGRREGLGGVGTGPGARGCALKAAAGIRPGLGLCTSTADEPPLVRRQRAGSPASAAAYATGQAHRSASTQPVTTLLARAAGSRKGRAAHLTLPARPRSRWMCLQWTAWGAQHQFAGGGIRL